MNRGSPQLDNCEGLDTCAAGFEDGTAKNLATPAVNLNNRTITDAVIRVAALHNWTVPSLEICAAALNIGTARVSPYTP